MQNNLLQQALARAMTALATVPYKNIQRLTVLDCTFVLNALPHNAPLAETRQLLAQRLQGWVSTKTIEQGDAYEIFAVLTALWKYSPSIVKGEWLASAIQRLLHSEAALGGPYYTGDTIAVAANVQIATFVSLVARPLPNMERFFATIVTSQYFEGTPLTTFGLLYIIAAAYDCTQLTQFIQDNRLYEPDWQTPQAQVVALNVLGARIPKADAKATLLTVCKQQQKNGFWRGERITKHDQRSRLVTTALIAETLHHYVYSSKSPSAHWQQRRQQVVQAAADTFRSHTEPLRSSALKAVSRVCKADKNFEITLFPQFFGHALDTRINLTPPAYTMLGLANLYLWVAYTIYDDFIDDEGTPSQLPVANVAMRASLDCFRLALPNNPHFQKYVANVFSGMDEANAWEVDNCRFAIQDNSIRIARLPKYGKCSVLATRAFGHALTPMAVLAHSAPSAQESRHIRVAFQHYLIARQLNDDMHDWGKDIQAGQASYVVTAILRDMRVKYDTHRFDALLPIMQRCFRRTTMPKIGARMLWHIAMSKQHFAKSQLMQATNDIYLLLDNLELSAFESIDRQLKSQAIAGISTGH